MGGKVALNYFPIVLKVSIICPKGNVHTSYMGCNTVSETSHTCFSSKVCEISKTGPDSLFRA